MTPQPNHQYIIYIGDSFSNAMHEHHWADQPRRLFQSYVVDDHVCHPSLVAEHFNLRLRNFSYGGKSWWYSRDKLYRALDEEPSLIEKTFAIVFMHTMWARANTDRDYICASTSKLEKTGSPDDELIDAERNYIKHYYDENFQNWAGEQWFREINRTFGDLPTVHFHCFPWTLEKNDLLPGKKFTTALVKIQISELVGTEKEIDHRTRQGDTRANHLSDHNNQALADITIEALENYVPGTAEIDLSRFDLPNPNGFRWPKSGYGTK